MENKVVLEEEQGIAQVQEETEMKAKVEVNEDGEKVVRLGNKVFKMELRDGEMDFRNMTHRDEKQLNVRYESTKIQLLQQITLCCAETEIILMKIAEKLGISQEDIDKALSREEK